MKRRCRWRSSSQRPHSRSDHNAVRFRHFYEWRGGGCSRELGSSRTRIEGLGSCSGRCRGRPRDHLPASCSARASRRPFGIEPTRRPGSTFGDRVRGETEHSTAAQEAEWDVEAGAICLMAKIATDKALRLRPRAMLEGRARASARHHRRRGSTRRSCRGKGAPATLQ
jgi:hypothetical protein